MVVSSLRYGNFSTTSLSFDAALDRVRELLQNEGFGVITEIDVAKTLKQKRDIDFRPYTILGACNPDFALEALKLEDQLGLLLPCNVVVTLRDGKTVISAVNPIAVLGVADKPELSSIAKQVDERLRRVLAAIALE